MELPATKKPLTAQEKLNQMGNKDPVKDRRLEDIIGFIQVVTVAPAGTPKKFWDSIKIFDDTGTYHLYVFVEGVGWKSIELV